MNTEIRLVGFSRRELTVLRRQCLKIAKQFDGVRVHVCGGEVSCPRIQIASTEHWDATTMTKIMEHIQEVLHNHNILDGHEREFVLGVYVRKGSSDALKMHREKMEVLD